VIGQHQHQEKRNGLHEERFREAVDSVVSSLFGQDLAGAIPSRGGGAESRG